MKLKFRVQLNRLFHASGTQLGPDGDLQVLVP